MSDIIIRLYKDFVVDKISFKYENLTWFWFDSQKQYWKECNSNKIIQDEYIIKYGVK